MPRSARSAALFEMHRRRHGDAHGHILVAHRQLAFSSLDLLDLKAAFGQAHVERRSRAILAAVLEGAETNLDPKGSIQ
jgi:hypothetical protein